MDKKTARETGLFQRSALNKALKNKYNQAIFEIVVSLCEDKSIIGLYVSKDDEVDTRKILAWCFQHGKTVAVPKVYGKTLKFYQIKSFDDLEEGVFHVLEPTTKTEINVADMDIIIVPLAAIDLFGNRVGYGKGYYDSVLKESTCKIGVCYQAQVVSKIEAEAHDIGLDAFISENGLQTLTKL